MKLIEGENSTIRGYHYISAIYYIGIANEALGNTEEAVQNYKEVLRYWGNPDMELKEIIDTRKRLDRLLS
jgi:hypothetical protein